jgi:hypothetical protein
MSKIQSFLPYDCSSLANYKAWAQGIGSALSSFGWTKTADSGQVIWSDLTLVASATLPTPISSYIFGAWSGGTAYVSGSATSSNVVTNSNLTYICIANTTLVLTAALQNSSATLGNLTTVAASSGGVAVYTVASGVTSSMVNQQFVVAGAGISANNAGTFICTATSGTTSITLSNPNATVQSGLSVASAVVSSSSVLSFVGTITGGGGNAYTSHSLVVSISGSGNSGTYTPTSSSTTAFALTATGTTITAAGTAIENTAPASDTIHWLPYNYEVWQSNDTLSSTNPIYLRLVYLSNGSNEPAIYAQVGGGQTSGTGYLVGNNIFNSGTEYKINSPTTPQGAALFECDFSQYEGSFGMFLWRSAYSASTTIPTFFAIDRAKDNFGNDLDANEEILVAAPGAIYASQVIFKPAAGNTMPLLTAISGDVGLCGAWSTIGFSGSGVSSSTVWNGNVAVSPIFPITGYVANPCLQAIAMLQNDVANGAFLNAVIYGTEHTYLMGYINISYALAGPAAAVGLRWD